MSNEEWREELRLAADRAPQIKTMRALLAEGRSVEEVHRLMGGAYPIGLIETLAADASKGSNAIEL